MSNVLNRAESSVTTLMEKMWRSDYPRLHVWPWSVGWPWSLNQPNFTRPSPAQRINLKYLAVDMALSSLLVALTLCGLFAALRALFPHPHGVATVWMLTHPKAAAAMFACAMAVGYASNLLAAWGWNRRASRLQSWTPTSPANLEEQ